MGDKKILIAESSVEFSEPLRDILEMHYDVCVCHSGLSVKGLLEDFLPDVLVMDLALPGLDGISLLKQICTMQVRPRILLTTCFMSPYVETVISGLGVDLVVLKPCKAEVLAERIEDLLEDEEPHLLMRLQSRSSVSSMLLELNIPGLVVEASTVREYSTEYAAHILGYVGAMSPEQWEYYKTIDGYEMDAEVGQDGLEKAYEEYKKIVKFG